MFKLINLHTLLSGATVVITAIEETVSAIEETAEVIAGTVSDGDAVIPVVETIDYTETLLQLNEGLALANGFLQYLTGFALFFVIIAICVFAYKFFRMFI